MFSEKNKINISFDKVAEKFFIKNTLKYKKKYNQSNADKQKTLKKIKFRTLSFASLYGTLGVLFLYLPQYIFPQYFNTSEYKIPLINKSVTLSVFELVYGFILVIIEIFMLMKGDLKAAGKIAALYGFSPDKNNEETDLIVKTALNKDRKKYTEIGINPYQKLSKTELILIRTLFLAKAFLSNFIFKIIIKRVLGRLAIREIVDLAGIPVYAFWNAYASAQIMRKTNMRMKAAELIIKTAEHFKNKFEKNKKFANILYDTFEYIAVTKKSFYPSDLIMAKHFFKTFNIKIKKEHKLSDNYLEKIKELPDDLKLATGQLLILGFLLDGKLGTFEIKNIKKLIENKIIPYSVEEIKNWTKKYKTGQGFEEMFTAKKQKSR